MGTTLRGCRLPIQSTQKKRKQYKTKSKLLCIFYLTLPARYKQAFAETQTIEFWAMPCFL